ncbi:MAG: AMP-binding protein [Planctomycetota bacterium]|nr:AMP-binding protein [Planctomycetota bacterium]
MSGKDQAKRLQEFQLEKLKAVLKETSSSNDFYRQKFEKSGFKISEHEGCQGLDELLGMLPFTEKRELQEDQEKNPPYGSNLTFALETYTRIHRTSGTTGSPIYWLDTPESWQWFIDCWKKVYLGAGVTAEDRIFFPFSFGPFIGFWGAFEAGLQAGNFCLAGGGMSSIGRLEYMLEHRITVVCCTPSYALHLAEVAQQEGINLPEGSVRALIVAGEPGGQIQGTRKLIEDSWGARVLDHHGMTEIGCVTFEDPASPGALVPLEEDFIVEVLEPGEATPAAAGVPGELVLTNLGRTASPLVRYRTGDLVRWRPNTGGELVLGFQPGGFLQGGILGRVDDMFFVRGNNVYPASVESAIREFHEVAEYRMRVVESGDLNSLEVDIEPTSAYIEQIEPIGELLAKRVEKALHDALLFRVQVFPVEPGSLPRFELKASRLVREKDNE